jgi:hypothetical protein
MVIYGAEFWEKMHYSWSKLDSVFDFKEKRKSCCILEVWIEAEHRVVFDTQHCKVKDPG